MRQIRYVVAVAEHLNFRHASRVLRVSQPSLSVQIQQLESELGAKLFTRSKKSVEITRAGEAFLGSAREALALLERSASAVKKADYGEAGTLRVGFVATSLFNLLPALLGAIKVQLPQVVVEQRECTSRAQIQAIQSGTMDLGLGYIEEVPLHVASGILSVERFLIVLPANHKAVEKEAISFEDLRGDLLMIPRKDLFPSLYQMIFDLLTVAGMSNMKMQEIDHPLTALALVSANGGFAFVPESANNLHFKGIVLRPLKGEVPLFETVAFWSKRDHDPLVQKVLAILKRLKRESSTPERIKSLAHKSSFSQNITSSTDGIIPSCADRTGETL